MIVLRCLQELWCKMVQVAKAIMDEMHEQGKAAGLRGFEQVRAVHLTKEAFSVELGLLTPALKVPCVLTCAKRLLCSFLSHQMHDGIRNWASRSHTCVHRQNGGIWKDTFPPCSISCTSNVIHNLHIDQGLLQQVIFPAPRLSRKVKTFIH